MTETTAIALVYILALILLTAGAWAAGAVMMLDHSRDEAQRDDPPDRD